MFLMFTLIHVTTMDQIFIFTGFCTIPNLLLLLRWIVKMYIEEEVRID
jgi:hypothetical protein